MRQRFQSRTIVTHDTIIEVPNTVNEMLRADWLDALATSGGTPIEGEQLKCRWERHPDGQGLWVAIVSGVAENGLGDREWRP
jgi:hypothetical protein